MTDADADGICRMDAVTRLSKSGQGAGRQLKLLKRCWSAWSALNFICGGVPISHKDLLPTKGVRTTSGSLVYKNVIPEEDEIVVERMSATGAILFGKTNTTRRHLEDWMVLRTSANYEAAAPWRHKWSLSELEL